MLNLLQYIFEACKYYVCFDVRANERSEALDEKSNENIMIQGRIPFLVSLSLSLNSLSLSLQTNTHQYIPLQLFETKSIMNL